MYRLYCFGRIAEKTFKIIFYNKIYENFKRNKAALKLLYFFLPEEKNELQQMQWLPCATESAYAIMFPCSRGYMDVYNRSGGFFRLEKERHPLVS